MSTPNPRRIALWVAAVALLAHAGLFAGGVWSFDALNYDDPQVLDAVEQSSAADLITGVTYYAYKPVYFLSLKVDALFGSAQIAVSHVVNWGLHALAAFLLVQLLFSLFGSLWLAGAAGLLFAVHPVHVENVAWLSERKDMLSLVFLLAAHLSWRAPRTGGALAVWLPALWLLLAGLSKGTAWSYAGVLCVDEWLARQSALGRALRALSVRGLVNLLIGGVKGALRYVGFNVGGEVGDTVGQSGGQVLDGVLREPTPPTTAREHMAYVWRPLLITLVGVGGVVLDATVALRSGAAGVEHGVSTLALAAAMAGVHLRYLVNLVAPASLSLDYAVDPAGSWASPWTWAGALLAVGVLVLLVRSLRRGHALPAFAAALWIFGLAPVNNLWPRTAALMADRYLYWPAIGLYLLLAHALARLPRARGWMLAGAALLLAILCEVRTGAFATSERVWSDAIDKAPHSALAYIQRGQALAAEARYPEAGADAEKALTLAPRPELRVRAMLLRCAALLGQGESDVLLAAANDASRYARGLRADAMVRDDPGAMQAQAEIFRGQALERLGDTPTALDAYRRAVTMDDGNWSAHYNYGTLLAAVQTEASLEESVNALRRALRLNPGYLEGALQLATVHARRGDKVRALRVLERAEQRHGRRADVLYARATIHLEVGNEWQTARNILRELRELDPQHPKGKQLESDIELAIGRAHLARGRGENKPELLRRAIDHFDEALKIQSRQWQAHLYAGDAQAELGGYGEARRRYRDARRVAPKERWIEGVMARTAALEAALDAQAAESRADIERAADTMAGAIGLDVRRIDLGAAPLEEELGLLREVVALRERGRRPESDHAASLLAIAALLVSGDDLTALRDLQDVFARLAGDEREPALLDTSLLLRAMLYERQADLVRAEQDYALLARRRPQDVLPRLRQLQITLRAGQARLRIARGFPDDAHKLADALRGVEKAAEAAQRFADAHPESSTAGLLAVQAEIGRERWIEALRRLNDLEKRFPHNPSVLRGFNAVYVAWYTSTRDPDLITEADRVMRRAIQTDPRDARTLMDFSQLWRLAGDLQVALRYARDARREERRSGGPASRMLGDLHVAIGHKALDGGQAETVRKAIEASRRVDPSRAGSWILEGKLVLASPAKNRFQRAYAMALKAKELEPFNDEVNRLLAECHRGRATSFLLSMGAIRAPREGSSQYAAWMALPESERTARLAKAKADMRAKAVAELGAALVHDPTGEEAPDTRRTVERLLEASPETQHERRQNAQAAYERGRRFQDAEAWVDALHAYEEAVSLHPRFRRAHFYLLQVAHFLLIGLPTDLPHGKETAERYLELAFRSLHALDSLDTTPPFAERWYYRGLLHVWIVGSETTEEAREVSRQAAIAAFDQFLVLKAAAGETPETSQPMTHAKARLKGLRKRNRK